MLQISPINNRTNYCPQTRLTMAKPLLKDTVSFKSKGTLMADHLENSVNKNMDRLNRIATIFLDVLESVAIRLKNMGVTFDREYCEKNIIKSAKSFVSKIIRSGSTTVPDQIRATLYIDNPYDLSILNDYLLPELKKRGYVIAKDERSLPDLDIRLADMENKAEKLSPELRKSISHPQKSGYEDIQMRLVRNFESRKNPILHELIILFGPNYAQAKHLESEKVYSFLRLFNELGVKQIGNSENSHYKFVMRFVDLINKMFNGKISQKLYENAKNKDLYGITEEIPITFSDQDICVFIDYFKRLQKELSLYYKEEKLSKPEEAAQLNKAIRNDRAIIEKIRKNLLETIDYFSSASN